MSITRAFRLSQLTADNDSKSNNIEGNNGYGLPMLSCSTVSALYLAVRSFAVCPLPELVVSIARTTDLARL